MWTRTCRQVARGIAAVLLSGSTLIGTIAVTLVLTDPSAAAVDDGSADILDIEIRQQVDTLLATASSVSDEGRDAFVDAFAGLLIVYAGDDAQQAAAIADYASESAPEHADSFAKAVNLIWPGTVPPSLRRPYRTRIDGKGGETDSAAGAAQAGSVTEAPPTERGAPAANGLAADSAATVSRALPQFGRSAWGQAGSFGPSAVPAVSTARVPNLRTASPIWP